MVIYAPSSDISGEEKAMLADYVSGGGKLLVMAGPVEEGALENLYSLLSDYGVEAEEGIVVERFEAFGASFIIEEVEDYGMYGLDVPELTVTVDYTIKDEDGKEVSDTFTLSVSRDPEELAAAEENDEDDEEITAYARVGESQIVYKISEYYYNNLMAASYNDLRHREVLTADFADVTQVDISLDGARYTLTTSGEGEDRSWQYQEEEIDIDEFRNALEDLRAEGTDSFTSDQPTGRKEIGLTVSLNHEDHPKVEIVLYRCDGSDCLAVVDGQPFALVSRADVVDLIEAVHAIVLN